LNGGGGTFQPPVAIDLPPQIPPGYHSPVAQQSSSVAVGDLNADGKLDLVVTGRSSISVYIGPGYYGPYYNHYTSGHVNVLLGNGDGTMGSAAVSDYPNQSLDGLALVDLDHDDQLDLLAAPSWSSTVYRFMGGGDGSLAAPVPVGTGGYSLGSLTLGDFNNDTHVDILMRGFSAALSLTTGRGDGTFNPPATIAPDPAFESARSVAVGDINGDGSLDIAYTTQRVEVTEYTPGYYGYYPSAGIVHAAVKVVLGGGDGTFSAPIASPLGSHDGLWGGGHSAVLADLSGDGLLDLAMAESLFGLLAVALNDGNWDPPPSLSIADVSITEGTGGSASAVFTVTLSGAASGPVSVNFAANSGTAGSGVDFTATSGTLVFAPGETSQTISVPIATDSLDEDDEQFGVTLSNVSGAIIIDGSAVGTIVDDDASPQLTIQDVSRSEGQRGNVNFTFNVSLSAASGRWVSVNFATANGTATTGDSDYFPTSGTVWFAPGQTTATIVVTVRGDKRKEANETFFVNLSGASGATIADGQGQGTITNDDGGGKGKGGGKPNKASLLAAFLLADDDVPGKRK
jgi:hypothetical protein